MSWTIVIVYLRLGLSLRLPLGCGQALGRLWPGCPGVRVRVAPGSRSARAWCGAAVTRAGVGESGGGGRMACGV